MDDVKKQFESIREAIAEYEKLINGPALFIYMNQRTYDKFSEYAKANAVYKEEPVFYTICGLKIIIDNSIENDDMFISDRNVDEWKDGDNDESCV